ncbi:anion permease [Desertifilum sp. FACHB-1129]|uniref:Sodium:solute symporter n=1 Tax=Desertifilum tharense IPPAS B-1220 TaxID=1781255 RepID=A0A1E5QKK1_9CYAN|nr:MULTISPECIES: SLC13 family permease [unclassified Desertifilum]MDA0210951.1 SLC13 family permease [Cyanobacteria bacterium FC1]OEJ74883.1 sodium:solute symporter [Desertifilum tharense IPPAS B-1220]MBD2313446.1 anion permease [Desertifilum sp. FACHB-1129]MBD2322316.1 anion permease [Desertifilum sp. FACHB-866]MBD2332478.1 anion permease [Desertifilum sp. FACHB-868]
MTKMPTVQTRKQAQRPPESIWTRFESKPSPKTQVKPKRQFRWVVDAVWPLASLAVAAIAILLPGSLPTQARLSLFAFALAVILWSTTRLNAAYIALIAMLLLVLSGGSPQEQLFDALASDIIWLMIGAFILGGAVQKTGLASRLTQLVVARAHNVSSVFWLVTTLLILLAFVIPSTSGRAAVVIPIFRSIAKAAGDRRITRALALLMPTIILVSTISALVGAGSHLIALDLLQQISSESISFLQWSIYGLPFGIVASYLSCWIVMRLFLDRKRRQRPIRVPQQAANRPLSQAEWTTLGIITGTIALWLTADWHGLEIATVTVVAAALLTAPGIGVLSWKDGLKAVSWNLIIFVGAALVLGHALIDSGAAQWIIDRLFGATGIAQASSPAILLLILSFISLTSHIYMTSHTARAAALVPALLYLGSSLQLNPVAVLFISTVGMDYCLTFPVSSKALLMFQELEGETYQPSDLLYLSAVLLLVHLVLMLAFYYGYWRWIGLAL